MKTLLNMDKIAQGLGAERRGKVAAAGGYFGAVQLVADIEARFRVPAGGGRATDPRWTERRLVPLAPKTLERLEAITARVREHGGVNVEPMQLERSCSKRPPSSSARTRPRNSFGPGERAADARAC